MTHIIPHNLGYSLINNIPLPEKDCLNLKNLIQQTESFIKRIRWRVFWYEKQQEKNFFDDEQPKNYGFKTGNTPPQHPILLPFESELYDLIGNIKFTTSSTQFQNQMKKDIKAMNTGGSVVVEADKTTNFYKVSAERYSTLLHQNITKNYRCAADDRKADIN